MAPLTTSPSSTLASLPGTFPPRSPPRSPPSSANPPRDVDPTPTGPSAIGSGRGRRISTSIQSRRTQVSLGLGVSFATMNDLGNPTPTVSSSSRPSSVSPAVSPSPPDSRNSQRTTSTSSHSRRTSVSSAAPPTSAGSGSSGNNSRLPSRRPSLSHLASFLSGIEHHTRVRNPGPRGGRGVSRSASRSQSRAGERRHYRRGTGGSSADGEGDDDSESGDGGDSSDDLISPGGGTFRGAASSRASSVAARSRRSSLSAGSPHPYLHSLVRENTSGGVGSGVQAAAARSEESLWEDDDGFPIAGGEDGGAVGAGESIESGWAPKTFKPLPTPRILSTEMEEEPFLDTAPSSPVPKRTRTADSYGQQSSGGEGGGLQGVDVFEEGERVGVDVWLEGRGGWVRDCFGESSEGGPGNGIGGPRELEVERRLGEGTYAM
ncbi:hypothetical protein BCR35DRAFT_221265 [Leucosporidium creatinivorum]|uniref:Uncharacterized protein n=1 Tax=Leucosporidium creatinivorum TaxID=106004 RepID=A0A1Y2D8F0_9BASI|nr:hypothetical protein BCR35DRAFT_221265 [Leucosporidium creatinivorum]